MATPAMPPETYIAFAGLIDQAALQRFFSAVNFAHQSNVEHIHLLLQSTGGGVGDGVCLYNYLRAMTIDLTIYNSGCVASIATIAYLGAKRRKVSAHASFMLHRTQSTLDHANTAALKAFLESSVLNDHLTEVILRTHIKMPAEKWAQLDNNDLFLTAEEAVEYGFADEIAEFSPPSAARIWSL